ncbi:MAG: UDP-N-acetylglucosamine 2-epimerase (hydrolyzing) [Alphaproteobacteria bacterium]|nr:UDP-N-acetylglucosamine 2-epimerase (hydrolyzing) [Alphaproteobacteria bacterium]
MRTIGVVTVARSDFSILKPVMSAIRETPDLRLAIVAAGMHLAPEFGYTVTDIEAAGFTVQERVEMLLSSDTPEGTAKSTGLGVIGFAQLFGRWRPDILLLMGDRFEMFAAAAAALPFGIPIAHLHGGEVSEGAIDDSLRHAITKLSHLHLVSTRRHRDRVIQMGEVPERVVWCGAPALDNLRTLESPDRTHLESRIGMPLSPAPLLVTFHPATHEPARTAGDVAALLAALAEDGSPVVFTAPNADAGGRAIRAAIEAGMARHERWRLVANLGLADYYGLLAHAAAMVGNSSSGIIEAASFGLPVVDIGSRQRGRTRGANVIHSEADRAAIAAAIARARSPAFRSGIAGIANPYDRDGATPRIVTALRELPLGARTRMKRFHDLPTAGEAA